MMRINEVVGAVVRQSWPGALLWMVIAPLIASAHHSSAYFAYADEYTELEGELASVAWTNPHVGLTLTTTGEAGEEEVWELELPGSLYSHERRGINQNLFREGDRIRVAGHASGRYERHFQATNILLDDGREVIIRERAGPRWYAELFTVEPEATADILRQRARTENIGLFRTWSKPFEGDDVYIGELPFREEANAARVAWDPLDNFVMRCEAPGMPDVMDSPYPLEFVDHGSWIELRAIGNYNLVARTIYIGGQANRADQTPSPTGYSVGHWEGDALIVETAEIDWPYFDNRGTPQSDTVAILERFTLSEDQSALNYQMTVTDLEVFTRPAVVTKNETYAALGEALPELSDCRY